MTSGTFVIGDIHGANRALNQVLEKSGFDFQKDYLICLGDVCDGWPETRECINTLLQIDHLTYLLGNHDFWALQWMRGEFPGETWTFQGGDATVRSYEGHPDPEHLNFLEEARLYYVKENKLFVHAGIDPEVPVEEQSSKTLIWDRDLASQALAHKENQTETKLTSFDEVYLGHTPIHKYGYEMPLKACEIWFMDTGAGWNGRLSMMNIYTKEIFASDKVPSFYPDHTGRF